MTNANTSTAFTDAETEERDVTASEKLAGIAHKKIDKAAEVGAAAEKTMQDTADKAARKAQDASARAEDASTEAVEKAKTAIEANPLAAAGAAFAIGFVVSSLMRR